MRLWRIERNDAMHGAEFLLGLVLIGMEHMYGMIALAAVLGIAAAVLLRKRKERGTDDEG